MAFNIETYALSTGLVFCIALVFSMLGLGGGMLYVPVFKWLELPFKTIAVPLSLLLNGVTTLSAFARYVREGLVDFRGGLPAALSALAMAPIGAHLMQYVPVHLLIKNSVNVRVRIDVIGDEERVAVAKMWDQVY